MKYLQGVVNVLCLLCLGLGTHFHLPLASAAAPPHNCNTTLWARICPPQPKNISVCMMCCESNKAQLINMGCTGPDVWPDFCGKVIEVKKSVGLDREFDGIGAISGGGATSRLLVDYPETQRNQILDYLFKPNFGASLQMLKVEIGAGLLTTDGSESCHMRTNTSVDLSVGYEWWLMTEAKKRNPNILLYGLPWAFPGWVGNNPETGLQNESGTPFDYPKQSARYILEWVRGAHEVYGLDIDYIGIWNESPWDNTYIKLLRSTLDEHGFHNTRIVAPDGGWGICRDLMADPELSASVDVIGLHYPSDFDRSFTDICPTGQAIWASEESSSYNDLNGAACWARVVQSHYVLSNITSSIMWNLVGAYYPGTSWFSSSMFTAVEPWSGHYGHMPVVWATAHVTQFTRVGWRYLRNGFGSGELEQGGYYTTTVDPTGSDFTIVVVKISYDHAPCTRPQLPDFLDEVAAETVIFHIDSSITAPHALPSKLALWRSNFEIKQPFFFVQEEDILIGTDGTFSLDVQIGDMITISTVRSANHGNFTNEPVPLSQPQFPLPYEASFEHTIPSQQPRYWSQMIGTFESKRLTQGNVTNTFVLQSTPQQPLDTWPGTIHHVPLTVIGMREWQDVRVAISIRLPNTTTAGACVGTRLDWTGDEGLMICVNRTSGWALTYGTPKRNDYNPPILEGILPFSITANRWYSLNFSTVRGVASSSFENMPLFINASVRDMETGFVGLGTTDFDAVAFDNVLIEPFVSGSNWDEIPALPSGCSVNATVGQVITVRHCNRNGIIASDQHFEILSNFQLRHVPSNLCVGIAATNASVITGTSLELQECNFTEPLQKFKYDYSNVQHKTVPFIYEPTNLTIAGSTDGSVSLQPLGWSGDDTKTSLFSYGWTQWTMFFSSSQLRNTRNVDPAVGEPMCLSRCSMP